MIDSDLVVYNEQFYFVCKYLFKNKEKLFIIDADDYDKIMNLNKSLHKIGNYIGFTQMIDKKVYTHYLHNIIMDYDINGGKGQKYTIDHINRIIRDNRKANLRLVSQSIQNENRDCKNRTAELPKDCGICIDEIPKCVYYCGPQSGHGDKFVLEIKRDNFRKTWSSTSSKNISLKDKLIEIKNIILEISKEYPKLFENKNIIENYSDEQIQLRKEFNEIIKLSKFECIKDNLVKVPKKILLDVDISEASKDMKKYLNTVDLTIRNGKRHKNNLPKNCNITPNMIPKYCYYKAETDKRGDAFIIDRHPKLPDGKRLWSTTSSKSVSTKDKYKQLLKKLKQIEKPNSGSKRN